MWHIAFKEVIPLVAPANIDDDKKINSSRFIRETVQRLKSFFWASLTLSLLESFMLHAVVSHYDITVPFDLTMNQLEKNGRLGILQS